MARSSSSTLGADTGAPSSVEQKIVALARADAQRCRNYEVGIEQEPGSGALAAYNVVAAQSSES